MSKEQHLIKAGRKLEQDLQRYVPGASITLGGWDGGPKGRDGQLHQLADADAYAQYRFYSGLGAVYVHIIPPSGMNMPELHSELASWRNYTVVAQQTERINPITAVSEIEQLASAAHMEPVDSVRQPLKLHGKELYHAQDLAGHDSIWARFANGNQPTLGILQIDDMMQITGRDLNPATQQKPLIVIIDTLTRSGMDVTPDILYSTHKQ